MRWSLHCDTVTALSAEKHQIVNKPWIIYIISAFHCVRRAVECSIIVCLLLKTNFTSWTNLNQVFSGKYQNTIALQTTYLVHSFQLDSLPLERFWNLTLLIQFSNRAIFCLHFQLLYLCIISCCSLRCIFQPQSDHIVINYGRINWMICVRNRSMCSYKSFVNLF